jgi:proteic killer suppression protein
MNMPGWNLHPLTANLEGHYTIGVNGNWCMTITFDGEDAVLVDCQDYP